MMKTAWIWGSALALSLLGTGLQAKELTPQQQRMAQCNKDAAGKKGEERKTFMSHCLKKKDSSQQERMTSCNHQAADMKGDERKAFMKSCLSGPAR